ncbi:MAG TPA: MFS transporter [Clostridiales bacterium]|nr:MFS transporter [Clostridiales bacterium]
MKRSKPRNGWLVLFTLYFYSICGSLNVLKVPPVFGLLMPYFNINSTTAGFITSIASLSALILVFPSAQIMRKLGPYRCGLLSISLVGLGGLVGAISTSLPMLLVGRFIEGFGTSMTGVTVSTLVAQYFQGPALGLPMAIWSTWFPVGSALGYIMSSNVGYAFNNWRAVWWAGVILEVIAFTLFATIVREKPSPETSRPDNGNAAKQPGFFLGIKNARVWCLGLSYTIMMLGNVGFLSFATQYFTQVLHIESAVAGSVSSLGYWFTAIGGIAAGIVSRLRKTSSLKPQFVQIIVCSACALAILPFGFLLPWSVMLPYLFALGFINGYTLAVIFATVPRIAVMPQLIGVSMSIIFFTQNMGSFFAPPLMGRLIEGGNWTNAALPMVGILTVGLLLTVAAALLKGEGSLLDKKARPAGAEADVKGGSDEIISGNGSSSGDSEEPGPPGSDSRPDVHPVLSAVSGDDTERSDSGE